MTNSEKEVKKILTKTKRWYQTDDGGWFPKDGKDSEEFERLYVRLDKLVSGEKSCVLVPALFEDFSYQHLVVSQYFKLYKDDDDLRREYFSKAALLGYLAGIMYHEKIGVSTTMYTYGRWISQNLACGWDEHADAIADAMIESINANNPPNSNARHNCIDTGSFISFAPWFILELYERFSGKSFNREYADMPEDKKFYKAYQDTIDVWDTPDLELVDKHIYILCDRHLDLIGVDMSDFEDFAVDGLCPYEIHTWLAYRQRSGLANPTEFTHPLMNQPHAEPIKGDRPLPIPKIDYIEPLLGLFSDCQSKSVFDARYLNPYKEVQS